MPPTSSSSSRSRPAAASPSQEHHVLVGRLPERMEAVRVANDPAQKSRVHRLAAEPEPRPVGVPRLRLEPDVARSGNAHRRRTMACRARDLPRRRDARPAVRPRLSNGTPSASYSSRCQLTVGCTTSRPSESRSSVPSSRARSSGCRSGASTALAASRSRVVTAAIAESSTSELGHGIAGSWFPGVRSRAGCP